MPANGRKRILLLGHDGQVGGQLYARLASRAAVVGRSFPEVDFMRPDDVRELVRCVRPGLIINAAAYTAVDRAETEPDRARRINAETPGCLAEEAKRLGALLVHYSTDFVFDGTQSRPYREDDAPCPLSVYGRTKLEGDEAVLAAGGAVLIFRVAWVYGLRGRNFLLTLRRLAAEGRPLRVVDDQIGCPTWCGSIAEATCRVLDRAWFEADGGGILPVRGLYHMACAGETSWYGFAKAFLPADADLTPIPTDEYPTPAPRPDYSVLDCGRLQDTFGVAMPHWRDALAQCLGQARH